MPRTLRGAVAQITEWAWAELAPGRLMPWLPVAFGAGIVIYFSAEREPALVAALAAFAAFALAALLARARPIAFPILLTCAALAAGFAVATARSSRIAHPVLQHAAWNVAVTGWIEVREERARSDRIVVKVHAIDGGRLNEAPDRVRVSVAKGTAPPVGSFIELKARLDTAPAPMRPGGYDFARDLYFQGIGATGFALGWIKPATPPAPEAVVHPSFQMSFAATLALVAAYERGLP